MDTSECQDITVLDNINKFLLDNPTLVKSLLKRFEDIHSPVGDRQPSSTSYQSQCYNYCNRFTQAEDELASLKEEVACFIKQTNANDFESSVLETCIKFIGNMRKTVSFFIHIHRLIINARISSRLPRCHLHSNSMVLLFPRDILVQQVLWEYMS
jgi:hypothetical protein